MTTAAVDHDLSSDQDEGGRKRTFGPDAVWPCFW
ncbi:hypothetical protein GA0115280_104516 [Streptomyces sp. Cmuel-A718b]|nr:hypothetical protein GA0115280_104516 [Streptomyces sp. Cmuel-A718b]